MNGQAILRREALVSAVINAVLSAGFFLLVFGTSGSVTAHALAPDSFPQTLMVSLMAALVPSLLVRRGRRMPLAPIFRRAVMSALIGAIIVGGVMFLALRHADTWTIPIAASLLFKAAIGGVLGAIVTRLTVGAVLSDLQRQSDWASPLVNDDHKKRCGPGVCNRSPKSKQ